MSNKKEPLSIIAVKTILAVIIFTGVGTIIIGGGWLIGNKAKRIIKSEKIAEIKLPVVDNEKINAEVDVFKFISKDSIILQKTIDDIDRDGKKEIILYYLSEPSFYPGNKKTGRIKFMILKINDKNDYDISWEYDWGSTIQEIDKNINRILIYDRETETPKIKFLVDYEATDGLHVFTCFNKLKKEFKKINVLNDDNKKFAKIKGPLEIKDIDSDGVDEIVASNQGYIYKWDEGNNVYKTIDSCFSLNVTQKAGDSKRKIYRDSRYGYEIEFNTSTTYIRCKTDTVRIGNFNISPPTVNIKSNEINEYKCELGEKKITGTTPSRIGTIVCTDIPTNNKFEIFRESNYVYHGDEITTYNLIKENIDKTFTVVQISTGGQRGVSAGLDDIVSTFKFIEN